MPCSPTSNTVLLNPYKDAELKQLAQHLGVSEITQANWRAEQGFALLITARGLGLMDYSQPKIQPVVVDFVAGKSQHRRLFGGGKGQMIAKAVGVSAHFKPHVFDATAGLGGDAFVLASLGCQVTMAERNPVVHALLADGLRRARLTEEADILAIVDAMKLLECDAKTALAGAGHVPEPEIIYLDPMFPSRKKSAAVKKEMQFFHAVVGADQDQHLLLESARQRAKYRVVVKRPRLAECIGQQPPTYQLSGKTSRYDIYVNQKLPQ
ncbi:class I SAM-dependent methyltransferase [Halioxenophilus aromaticivorans]|uniref:Ribosomal RNA small subunit methyltransferase J n=1 Tax=Halioxenophilus aromaticivorans TaxID=1306992 RepID=A0AAV3TZG5_9ALTE